MLVVLDLKQGRILSNLPHRNPFMEQLTLAVIPEDHDLVSAAVWCQHIENIPNSSVAGNGYGKFLPVPSPERTIRLVHSVNSLSLRFTTF